MRSKKEKGFDRRRMRLYSYALAVSEENASGGKIVTAPTCGACGVLPASLLFMQEKKKLPDKKILCGLAAAGIIGNLVKYNGSISGAEVGCQGEIGTACSMAAAAITELSGRSPEKVEFAAENAMEHLLGLTCDPIEGLVQIPCIERNVMAAGRALESAEYALVSDWKHHMSFDDIIKVMKRTGKDMHKAYRETSIGGIAKAWRDS